MTFLSHPVFERVRKWFRPSPPANPKEARKLWAETLRSGQHKQGKNNLHVKKGPAYDEDRLCCMGVACVLYQQYVGGLTVKDNGVGRIRYNGTSAVLPQAVQDWLGLQTAAGSFNDPWNVALDSLVSMNDRGRTFRQIADLIEAEPKGLVTS